MERDAAQRPGAERFQLRLARDDEPARRVGERDGKIYAVDRSQPSVAGKALAWPGGAHGIAITPFKIDERRAPLIVQGGVIRRGG